MRLNTRDIYRFMKAISPSNGCWIWMKNTTKDRYGQVYIDGKQRTSSRVAHEIFNGPIADGKFVLHSCDNPPCCNPSHLRAGTHMENVEDMMRKFRAKTTLDPIHIPQIRKMIAEKKTYTAIGIYFGVTCQTISQIARGRSWRLSP